MDTTTPEAVGFSSARLLRIDQAMQRYVDEGKLAGMVTAVARRGRLVHMEKYGLMDVEAGKPMQLDTMFRIYSMTKPITSVAVMMLYAVGFGLGGQVVLDVAQTQNVGSVGNWGWGGAASTEFWIDYQEELVGVLMVQLMPYGHYPVGTDFQVAVYQALVD